MRRLDKIKEIENYITELDSMVFDSITKELIQDVSELVKKLKP